jgi:Xaa-Pro aminopeptidase
MQQDIFIELLNARRRKYTELLQNSKQVLLIKAKSEIFHLIGVNISYGVVLIDKSNTIFLLTDARYVELIKAESKAEGLLCIELRGKLDSTLTTLCKEKNYNTVYLNKTDIAVDEYEILTKTLTVNKIKYEAINYEQSKMRVYKDSHALKCIERAVHISEAALHGIEKDIRIGDSEVDISNKLICNMYQNGATGIAFPPIVALNQRSAFPHSTPSQESCIKAELSSLLLIDFGCSYLGYCSDITRVFAINSSTDDFESVYHKVYSTQQAVEESIRSNVTSCKQLAEVANEHLGEKLIHGLGHGVGIDVHEAPYLSQISKDELQENTAFTIEPGIYTPGKFGVRIEDTYLYVDATLKCLKRDDTSYLKILKPA